MSVIPPCLGHSKVPHLFPFVIRFNIHQNVVDAPIVSSRYLGILKLKGVRHRPHKMKHHHVVLNSNRRHALNGAPLTDRDSTGAPPSSRYIRVIPRYCLCCTVLI